MRYVVVVYALGFIVNMISPNFYYDYLMLDIDMLLKGQVWRLITFIIQPMDDNLFLMLLLLYVYYSIGTSLEHVWGTFRFNLYYFMGIFFNMLAVVIIYLITKIILGAGVSFPVSLTYLNLSMLLAFAATFPDARFLLMFLIPVKAKYLLVGYFVILGYNIFQAFVYGGMWYGIFVSITILVAMANFFIYFMMIKSHLSPRNIKRKVDFTKNYRAGTRAAMSHSTVDPQTGHKIITRHKCAVCGRTELDGENIEFRFCSKCNGNYEYCQDHLFTHEHIQ